ncbi:MAG: hypothetical protein QG637_860, partial [Chloroflexota bacterium]|nr:hypothetical protein [Chloroflexota bacterium]
MPQTSPRSAVRGKAAAVREYHYDESRPGKPLYLLIPGGLIAVAALALIIYAFYAMFVGETLDTSLGAVLVAVLAPVYIGGVFLFSYGYELYDVRKALRLTAIVVVTTILVVVIIAALFFLIGGSKKSGSSDSDKSSSDTDKSASGGRKGGALSSIGASVNKARISSRVRSSSGSSVLHSWSGPIIDINFPTRTVTKTAVRQVNVPVAPQPITCLSCGRSYVPAETAYTCPGCGTAAPQPLVAQSREGDRRSAMVASDGSPLDAADKRTMFDALIGQFRGRRGVFIQGRSLCLIEVAAVESNAAEMRATLAAVSDPQLVGTVGETGLAYA